MIGPGEVMVALIVIGLPVLTLMLIANRFFRLREKKLEVEAGMAAEKAAQYASRSHELALRDPPRRRASRQALPTANKAS
jgi:hypothetical protein